ncbi:aminoglycoside phosphotransferase family protein [Streptomyces sp. NBC_00133]|uniref:aminoglycoside phosphotransferase family protein n=1 Tax=Streptomyces sp. NBC_00133 TaxID=2903624 RepID=UPI0032471B43
MSSDTRGRIEAALGCRLSPITHDQPHHNTHYKGVTADGTTLFIKVIDGHPAYYTAELRAQHHLTATHIPTPKIVAHGTLDEERRWLAYEWHDLEPFVLSPDRIRRAGRLLGDLHAVTSGVQDDQLRRYADVRELIIKKIALVARIDPPLAERIQKISDQLLADSQNAVPDSGVCLLHGDMGWRNLHVNSHDQMWLLDFEHAAIGHPLLDFAKLWDRELNAPEDREAFLSGYGHSQMTEPVRHEEIDSVRLWAAAGIFPYARPRGDHDFERHAYEILDRLEGGR